MPGTGHTIGSVGLIVLHPKVPPIAGTAQSDHVLQVCPFPAHPPPLGQLPHAVCAGDLPLSCDPTKLFHCLTASRLQRPTSSHVLIRTPASINPSNRSPRPLRCRSCAGQGSSSATGPSFSGEAVRSQAPVSGLQNHLLCPRRTVRHRQVLWAETRGGAIPK